jgi:hypothetical protein
MFFRESNPRRFRPNFGIYGLEEDLVFNQSVNYCLGILPTRPIKIVILLNQSVIYCQQNIIR